MPERQQCGGWGPSQTVKLPCLAITHTLFLSEDTLLGTSHTRRKNWDRFFEAGELCSARPFLLLSQNLGRGWVAGRRPRARDTASRRKGSECGLRSPAQPSPSEPLAVGHASLRLSGCARIQWAWIRAWLPGPLLKEEGPCPLPAQRRNRAVPGGGRHGQRECSRRACVESARGKMKSGFHTSSF